MKISKAGVTGIENKTFRVNKIRLSDKSKIQFRKCFRNSADDMITALEKVEKGEFEDWIKETEYQEA